MSNYREGDIVEISTDTLELTEAEDFLRTLIGRKIKIIDVTNEYNDKKVPTYKCVFEINNKIISRNNGIYFPFVDADFKYYKEKI